MCMECSRWPIWGCWAETAGWTIQNQNLHERTHHHMCMTGPSAHPSGPPGAARHERRGGGVDGGKMHGQGGGAFLIIFFLSSMTVPNSKPLTLKGSDQPPKLWFYIRVSVPQRPFWYPRAMYFSMYVFGLLYYTWPHS